MKKIELEKNVTCTMINTSQYKDVLISVRFLCEVTRKDVLIRNILSQMLQDRCEMWPTKQALSSHLDSLYGATVSTKGYIYGKSHAFEFRLQAINDQYTSENTFERLFKTAKEFIFNPLMKNGLLDDELFEEAKRELSFSLARRMENPQSKAVSNACKIMGKDQTLAETQLYLPEEIDEITLEDVTSMVDQMIKKDKIMIFVIGKIDESVTEAYVKRFFEFKPREINIQSVYNLKGCPFTETRDSSQIDQTILVMMVESKVTIDTDDYWKMRVANALFGQLPTSLLFQEVREKRSLCYSVSSNAMPFEGALMVSTGIQKSKIDETKQCILDQFDRMKKGDFSDEDLEVAIVMLKNAILGSHDDPMSTINFAFQNVLLDKEETIDECIQQIENTTKEDVVRIFSELRHCVTYILEQENENESAY